MNNQPELGPVRRCVNGCYFNADDGSECVNCANTDRQYAESGPVKAGEGTALQSALQVVHDSIEESRADGDIVTIHRRYLEILLAALPALTPIQQCPSCWWPTYDRPVLPALTPELPMILTATQAEAALIARSQGKDAYAVECILFAFVNLRNSVLPLTPEGTREKGTR